MRSNLLVLVTALAAASSAHAAVVVFSGALTATDPTFNRPSGVGSLSGVGTAVAYDTYTFTAAAAGPYSVNSSYVAGGLDGYLFVYSPTFNPAAGLTNLKAADDDGTGLTDSLIPDADNGAYGPAVTSATVLTLTPGATYVVVQAAFDNATLADGLGPYTITITGAAVPEPTTLAALSSIAAFGLRRRRA